MPASKSKYEPERLNLWVRGALVGVLLGLTAVFVVAWRLNPYDEGGQARTMETHRQMGLPECSFKAQTKLPCPACGMTTSFALLVRGDVSNSLRANWVGTLLASFCMLAIPWSAATAFRAKPVFVRSLEASMIVFVSTLLVLMMTRWGIVLLMMRLAGEI